MQPDCTYAAFMPRWQKWEQWELEAFMYYSKTVFLVASLENES